MPAGLILALLSIYTLSHVFGRTALYIFTVFFMFILYKYLTMIHTVQIGKDNTALFKSYLNKTNISSDNISKIEDYDFFIRLTHNRGTSNLVCLFSQFSNMKVRLSNLNKDIEFVRYAKVDHKSDSLLTKIFRWIFILLFWCF